MKIILIIFILFIKNAISLDVNPQELTCMNDLAFNTGDQYPTISVKSTPFSKGSDYSCYSNGSVLENVLNNTNKNLQYLLQYRTINHVLQYYYLTIGELSCLPYLTFFKSVNIRIEKSFLETINPTIEEMDITSNLQVVDFVIGPLNQMNYKVTQITPESIKNIKSGCGNVIAVIDESNTFGPMIRSMSKVMCFDGKIGNLQFSGDYSINFPILKSITFSLPSKTPTQFIDLSNLKQVGSLLLFPGMNFNIDGVFPFSKLPQFTSHFEMSNGNITVWPDFDIFKNIRYLEMQNMNIGGPIGINPLGSDSQLYSAYLFINKITGTIDESWCSIYTTYRSNLLTGKIPYCFYCYLNISSVSSMFSVNNFDNYFPSNVSCNESQIRPQLSIESGIVKISVITLVWIFQISFIKPCLNFTFPTGTVSPVIYSMVQTNNTFDIDGAYLSYNRSNIMVKIGALDCRITNDSTTFYKAKCEIDYPIKDQGKKVIPWNWLTIGNRICNVTNHYVSSYTQVSINGGILNFYGNF
ncbi:hypothetical protein ACTA71_005128 [Dictyostelium dimigraforme]